MTFKTLSDAEKKTIRENLKALIIEKVGDDGLVNVGRGTSEFLEVPHTVMVSAIMDIQPDYRTYYIPFTRKSEPERQLSIKVIASANLGYPALLRRKGEIQEFTESDRDRIHSR